MLIVLALLFWFGYKSPIMVVQLWENPWQNLQIIIGPAIVLGLAQGAYIARMSRSCLLEVIREDYVRTARAKGAVERAVVLRHALPNALLPVITISGRAARLRAGRLGGGGAGLRGARASGAPSSPPSSSATSSWCRTWCCSTRSSSSVVNALVDLSYAWLDPRIRYQ